MTHGGNVWQGAGPEAWLDFSANIRPEGPPDWVQQALREALNEVRYYPDPEMKQTKAAIGKTLDLDPAWVLPTVGGISALDLALRLPGEAVVLPVPCFSEYAWLAEKNGKRVLRLPVLGEDFHVSGITDALRDKLPENSIVCVGNPGNPLGTTMEQGEVEALLARVEAAHGWLVLDEAFISYCPERSARQMIAAHARLLIAGSLTKNLGIPGVRLGYLCAQPQVLAKVQRYQLTWEVNCFAAAVARALPAHRDELQKDAIRSHERRERLALDLQRLGAAVYPSEAPFLLARFSAPVTPLAARLRARGILVRACQDYDIIADDRHLRLAVKDEAANARLIEALREALTCGENH